MSGRDSIDTESRRRNIVFQTWRVRPVQLSETPVESGLLGGELLAQIFWRGGSRPPGVNGKRVDSEREPAHECEHGEDPGCEEAIQDGECQKRHVTLSFRRRIDLLPIADHRAFRNPCEQREKSIRLALRLWRRSTL